MNRVQKLFQLICVCAIVGCADAQRRFTNGESPGVIVIVPQKHGELPTDFKVALTGGGPTPLWRIEPDSTSPSKGSVIVQRSMDDTSYRFPLCIYQPFQAADVSAEVKFKALAGSVDQAAGLVLRYADENYYVARANALEDNVNLFKTVDGKRSKILEVPAKVTSGQWHSLRFTALGSHLEVFLDDAKVIAIDDKTFEQPGKIGVWTKADSVIAFQDLTVKRIP